MMLRNAFLFAVNAWELSQADRIKKITWVREHCFIECPYCKLKQKICFSESRYGNALGLCRDSKNCGKMYNAMEVDITDRDGHPMNQDYPFPESLRHLFKDQNIIFSALPWYDQRVWKPAPLRTGENVLQ